MEGGEKKTSSDPQESTATVSSKLLFQNGSINDNESEREVLESNIHEAKEEDLSVTGPKSDDSKSLLTVAEGETAVEKDVTVQGRNSESVVAEANYDGSELISAEVKIENVEGQNGVEGMNAGQTVADEEEGTMADEGKPLGVTEIDGEEPMVADGDKAMATDMETDEDAAMADEEKVGTESPEQPIKTRGSGKKRKRGGKTPQATPKSTGGGGKTVEEEDVCFMCYDGGNLVICDKRDCPKAYHPSCINREEAFFKTRGKWDCGWHQCSICSKKAEYMCYTCTFSLCKSCIKTDDILRVRKKEKKGFCESCMKIVMLIEKNPQENQENLEFNDINSGEYLFKDYWTDMKAKLNITLSELDEAKNVWKGPNSTGKQELPAGHSDGDSGSEKETPSENLVSQTKQKRRRKSKKPKIQWASKDLLDFVTHMGKDTSYKSQFDVQALLLEYIKTNKLRDSRRKSQINCDATLQGLFGKPRVGHFEMLKLLESHLLIKEDDYIQGSVVDTERDEEKTKDKRRKKRKTSVQEPQSNRKDYAAIDTHNINLIYLRRKLVEDLLDDPESFRSKIVGTFVRIRISGASHSQDIYRLVQVTGTTTTGDHYAVGEKATDFMLEILNLDKIESISIDTISNQECTEDECKRLRQSIKCGLSNRLTVGGILDKAIELQAIRVDDWLETEVARLNHLRDRASDLGRKKELRECVEKLEVLKRPEERARRLQDIPVIHDDPTMDPKYESEDDKKQDTNTRSLDSQFSKRRDYPSKESWRGTGTGTNTSRNNRRDYPSKDADTSPCMGHNNDNSRDQGRERSVQPPPSSAKETEKTVGSSKVEVLGSEKIWHYKDPTEKVQGPFSLAQLRKWEKKEFFPVDLRVWRTNENEKDSILLTDALEGRFTVKTETHGFANLPSPTPNQSLEQASLQVGPSPYHKGLQSPTPNGSQLAASLAAGGSKEASAMVQPLPRQNVYSWSGGPAQNQSPNQSLEHASLQVGPSPYHEGLQSPTPNGSQRAASLAAGGSKEANAMAQPLPRQNVYSWSGGPAQNHQLNHQDIRFGNTGIVGPWGTLNVNPSLRFVAGPGTLNPGWVPPQPVPGFAPSQLWGVGPGPTQVPIVFGNGNPGEVGSAIDLNQGWHMGGGRWEWNGSDFYNNRGGGGGRGRGFNG